MTDIAQHQPYLALMASFLDGMLAVEAFCDQYIKQWVRDRDAAWEVEQAKKATWSQPYDELLIAAFQRGEMSAKEFQKERAELWGYADDIEFQNMRDAMHSACMCWYPCPELDGKIDEAQLRQEVKDALTSYQMLEKPLAKVA